MLRFTDSTLRISILLAYMHPLLLKNKSEMLFGT